MLDALMFSDKIRAITVLSEGGHISETSSNLTGKVGPSALAAIKREKCEPWRSKNYYF